MAVYNCKRDSSLKDIYLNDEQFRNPVLKYQNDAILIQIYLFL